MSFTSSNLILEHGFPELQSNFIATSVADVPWMSWYVTSLIFTPEACNNKKEKKKEHVNFPLIDRS